MKLRTIKKFEKPTDVIIFGCCVPFTYETDISITDDYVLFDIITNGKSTGNAIGGHYYESDGYISITTVEEFLNMNFSDYMRNDVDIKLLKNFVGEFKLRVTYDGEEYNTDKTKPDEYLVDYNFSKDEDFFPDVVIDVVSDEICKLIDYDDAINDKYMLIKNRTEKLKKLKNEM